MHGKSAAVHVIRLFAQKVEKLGVTDGQQEIRVVGCVAHDQEQRGFLVAKRIKRKLVVPGQFPYFRDVENGEPTARADQNTFEGFASRQLSRTF
jgi:hypothetical protein